jgi:hypothetical protein
MLIHTYIKKVDIYLIQIHRCLSVFFSQSVDDISLKAS